MDPLSLEHDAEDNLPARFERALAEVMAVHGLDFARAKLAVAVSGGPDSLALCALLRDWAVARGGIEVHALIVDHGLRAESGQEAQGVRAIVEGLGVKAQVLVWQTEKPEARIQEEARAARYGLMAEYCEAQGIAFLFLGHHRDDQAETVLFRLAKGSGLDGLAGMRAVFSYDKNLTLVRPLLEFDKNALVEFCRGRNLSFISDPSNQNEKFARVRLRKAQEILEEEGLSAKRLLVTAKRLARARDALEKIAESLYSESIKLKNTKQIVLKLDLFSDTPDEIILRCLLLALRDLQPGAYYAPRMEKIEALLYDLISAKNGNAPFRKRTLGGVIFTLDERVGELRMDKE